jgi:RND superfamily putative drug exporter
MSTYLYRLAHFAFRRRRLVLAVWLAVAIAAIALAQASGGKTNDTFTIPGTESQNAAGVLTTKLPAFSGGQSTIVFATTSGSAKVTDPVAKAAIETAMTKLKSVPQVSNVVSPFQSHQISQSGKVALGTVQWSATAANVKDANLNAVKAAMKPVQADGVEVEYNGSVYPGWRLPISELPELIGLIIAFIILMITFGAFAAAGMPILGAIIGVITTLMGITALASVLTIASASTTVALMLGLSCGIDYGLFILSRHRTNLLNGMTPEESVPLAMGTAGSSVVFAGLTVIIALCGLSVVGIPFLTVMGLAAAGSVAVALLIALTLVPAMLGFAGIKVAKFARLPLLGARAERVARRSAAHPDSTAGAGWARFVVRFRVPVLIGGIILLGVLALPALKIQLGLPSGASQSAGNTQRKAYDLTTEGFGAGFNGALLIVAQDAGTPAATQQIATALTKFPDVAKVSPVVAENGISLIKLIPDSGPNDSATSTLVHALRDNRAAIEGSTGAHILIGGTTASNIDVSAKLSSALPVFLIVVVGLAFLLLTFAFRTILVPIKSILGFLLSMVAALGAQVAMFQWGWGQHIFGITRSETISFLPIIMLAIIFGLSSDYEVFVVSRIKEDYTKNGDARRAVQRGTGVSARVVTAAAMIMFSIFVAFMFTSDPTIKAIGFSFAAGVFLDAFVVRLTLVPAVMAIFGSRLWYHPKWFARYIPNPDIEGQRLEHKLAEGKLAVPETRTTVRLGSASPGGRPPGTPRCEASPREEPRGPCTTVRLGKDLFAERIVVPVLQRSRRALVVLESRIVARAGSCDAGDHGDQVRRPRGAGGGRSGGATTRPRRGTRARTRGRGRPLGRLASPWRLDGAPALHPGRGVRRARRR